MSGLVPNLPAAERIISAIDTSSDAKARNLARVAKLAGAWVVKIGLEYQSSASWSEASVLAETYGLSWVADAKLHDIPNTVAGVVNNLAELKHPPVGITIHTKTGEKSLQAAQEITGEAGIMLLGVTHLTSIDDEETLLYEHVLPKTVVRREALRAVWSGIGGLVCAGTEVDMVKKDETTRHLFTMIPGTRSKSADQDDQARVTTPSQAIRRGADLLVIGRQISNAPDPAEAYQAIVEEIELALKKVT